MRKRKNTPDTAEEQEELEILSMQDEINPEESQEEEFLEEEEDKVSPGQKDQSLPAKVERFTQRESLGNKNKISLKDILGGEILTRSTFRKQFGLIAVCVFYVILYITNRYQAQQELIEIEELKIELQKQKYYSLTRSGEFTIRSRQSQVEKMLKQTPDSMLVTPKEPPFIIRTNTEEEE